VLLSVTFSQMSLINEETFPIKEESIVIYKINKIELARKRFFENNYKMRFPQNHYVTKNQGMQLVLLHV
jgi:hypothetical protein